MFIYPKRKIIFMVTITLFLLNGFGVNVYAQHIWRTNIQSVGLFFIIL